MYKKSEQLEVVRASKIFTLTGEKVARGRDALFAPMGFLNDAVLVAQNGCIIAVETWVEFKRRVNIPAYNFKDLGDVSLAPAFINAHCHLELSHLRGENNLNLVQGEGFVPWVKSVLEAVTIGKNLSQELYTQSLCKAIDELLISYTQAIGDVNSGTCLQLSEYLIKAGINTHFFLESFGYGLDAVPSSWDSLPLEWKQETPQALNDSNTLIMASLAGHSLYSCSSDNLQQAKAWTKAHSRTFSIHLAEHLDELEFLQTGKGALAELLAVRVLPTDFVVPSLSPIYLADKLGLLDEQTLAVHCVHCTPSELNLMGERKIFIALCPRSNSFIGVGEVDLKALINSHVGLCLGTDSLASNSDLNMLNEISALKKLAQKQDFELPLRTIIRMTSLNPAFALGFIKNKNFALGRLEKAYKFCYSVFENEN